jgi:hypothetical protein
VTMTKTRTEIEPGELDALVGALERRANDDGVRVVDETTITSAPIKRALGGIPADADRMVFGYQRDYWDAEPDEYIVIVVKYANDFWGTGAFINTDLKGWWRDAGGMYFESAPTGLRSVYGWHFSNVEWLLARPIDTETLEKQRAVLRINENEFALKDARAKVREAQDAIKRKQEFIVAAEEAIAGELKDAVAQCKARVRDLTAEKKRLAAAKVEVPA